jgi:hypothetical protein
MVSPVPESPAWVGAIYPTICKTGWNCTSVSVHPHTVASTSCGQIQSGQEFENQASIAATREAV